MTNRPRSVTVVFGFFGLNALVWLAFGLLIAFNLHPALPNDPLLKGLMAILSLGLAGTLLGLLFLLLRRSQIAYFGAVGLLALSCLMLVFDDFGLADLVFLLISLAPLVLLLKDRAWYLEKRPC